MCKVNAYPDAIFSWIYEHNNPNDPACVNSRTRFIITFVYCPFLWVSKLKTKTDILTMEAEIIAMDHYCRSFFFIVGIDTSLGKAVGIPMGDTTMNISVPKEIQVLWYWLKLFHHSSFCVVSTMQTRLFDFVRRLVSEGSSF